MQKTGNYRWVVVVLLFLATTINYIDRQVMGLLKSDLSREFHWTETIYGYIVTTFTIAYAAGLFIFGRMVDRIGSKRGYVVSIIVWSVAACGHAFVKSTVVFGFMRSALGLGEGGNFPAAIRSVAEWFPKKERALATGIFNSGSNIAAVVGPPLVTWILVSYGWREAFLWTGALGFLWLIFWWLFYEVPSKHKKVTQEEVSYIQSDGEEADTTRISFFTIIAIKQTWMFAIGKFFSDPIWWFYLFWIPDYFYEGYGLQLKDSWMYVSTIYLLASFGSIAGGYLPGWLIKKGWDVHKARKTALFIYACCVIPIVLVQFTNEPWTAVLLVGLAASAHQAWSANLFTTTSDNFPKKAVGSVVGVGGMVGSLSSAVFPLCVGTILDHFKSLGNINIGYNIIFTICSCAYIIAWLSMHFISKIKQTTQLQQ